MGGRFQREGRHLATCWLGKVSGHPWVIQMALATSGTRSNSRLPASQPAALASDGCLVPVESSRKVLALASLSLSIVARNWSASVAVRSSEDGCKRAASALAQAA